MSKLPKFTFSQSEKDIWFHGCQVCAEVLKDELESRPGEWRFGHEQIPRLMFGDLENPMVKFLQSWQIGYTCGSVYCVNLNQITKHRITNFHKLDLFFAAHEMITLFKDVYKIPTEIEYQDSYSSKTY